MRRELSNRRQFTWDEYSWY